MRHRVVIRFRVHRRDGKDVIVICGVVSILTSIFKINIAVFKVCLSVGICAKLPVV